MGVPEPPFNLRRSLTMPRLAPGHEVKSGFDTAQGFTVTNNTPQNVYLQPPSGAFEKIEPGKVSTAHKDYGNYPLHVNDNTNSPIYLTIQVDLNSGSFTVNSGTQRGAFAVASNFA